MAICRCRGCLVPPWALRCVQLHRHVLPLIVYDSAGRRRIFPDPERVEILPLCARAGHHNVIFAAPLFFFLPVFVGAGGDAFGATCTVSAHKRLAAKLAAAAFCTRSRLLPGSSTLFLMRSQSDVDFSLNKLSSLVDVPTPSKRFVDCCTRRSSALSL